MSQSVRTGQLDLNGLKEYFSTNLSGSATNTTGYYPYTGNPAEFSTYTQLTGISGDVSGYINTVSGAISSRIGTSGVALSGFTISVNTDLTSNFSLLSGDFIDLSGQYISTKTLSTGNKADINTLSGNLITTGQTLISSITGESGVGVSGYVTGFVKGVSGVLNTTVSNLDSSLRSHVSSDYLSKTDVTGTISGDIHFKKSPQFNLGIELNDISSHANVSTVQTGTLFYNLITGETVSGASFETMTSYVRMPHSGDSANQNLVMGSFMYSGGIP